MSSLAKAAFAVALGWALAAPVGAATAQSDADAFLRLPTQEIEGAQIGWYFDSLEAFTHAVETTRPMIVCSVTRPRVQRRSSRSTSRPVRS